MKNKPRFTLLLLVAALLTGGTTGCNTIHGAGRDIEQAGKHIERAAH